MENWRKRNILLPHPLTKDINRRHKNAKRNHKDNLAIPSTRDNDLNTFGWQICWYKLTYFCLMPLLSKRSLHFYRHHRGQWEPTREPASFALNTITTQQANRSPNSSQLAREWDRGEALSSRSRNSVWHQIGAKILWIILTSCQYLTVMDLSVYLVQVNDKMGSMGYRQILQIIWRLKFGKSSGSPALVTFHKNKLTGSLSLTSSLQVNYH